MTYKELQFPKDSLFLVTGGAGFIGSNLCEAILKMGYKVRCLDDLSTGKQANVNLFLDNPNYEFIKGDIKDLDTCMKACEGVDYVLNEAAWGSVPRSIEMPLFYCANNIQFQIHDGFTIKDGHPTFHKTYSDPVNAREFAAKLIKRDYRAGYTLPEMPE